MSPATCNTISKRICQEGHANALALNRDCSQIAVAGRSLLKVYSIEPDGFVEVCNMRGGKNQNLSYSSNDVAWSACDANLLATAATNGVISVWDLSKFGRQKQLHVYTEHERTAHTVTFHGSEPHLLVSGSQDGTIKCFDLRCDKAVHTYFSNAESVRDVKFSPQQPNQFAAVSENGTVQLWDLKRPDRCQLQFTAHSGPVYTCDWHPTQPWLATGSRDRQIKVWRMDQKPALEYNIHTIAVVGRVKWRPDRQHHIASCALVVDYSIYIWDVRRPYIPYASFTEHTNVTTGIAFKGNDPHVLMSASKDSTIFKHSFQDATRPTTKTNPQATSFNLNGDFLFSYKVKNVPGASAGATCGTAAAAAGSTSAATTTNTATAAAASVPSSAPSTPRASGGASSFIADTISSVCSPKVTPPQPAVGTQPAEQFHLAKSCLLSYTTGSGLDSLHHLHHHRSASGGMPRDYDAFRGCARDYILTGACLPDICEYNADIARKYGKANVSMLWRFVGNQYGDDTMATGGSGAGGGQGSGGGGGGTGDGQRKSIGGAGGAAGRLNKLHHHQHLHHHAANSATGANKLGAGSCVSGGGGSSSGGGGAGDASELEALAQMCCDDLKLQDFRHPKSGEFKHPSSAAGGGSGSGSGGAGGNAPTGSTAAGPIPPATASGSSASAAMMLAAYDQSADSMMSYMYGEAEELTVHEVKGLRNGFLYIGPHDLTKGWSLPHNNLNELQSRKAEQDMEAESRHQAQEEGMLLPEIPSVLKLGAQPTYQSWQPHDVLADGLQLQTDIGDVQTAVCILIAMGERRLQLPIDELTHEAWLLSYVELLHRHQLWSEATEVINLAWIHSVRELNQQSTTLHTNCGDCGKPMNNAAGWYCGRCKSARASDCAVCNRPVRGLYAWCQGCAHGGHLEHMRQWFSDHSKCPKCGHMCEHD